MGAGGLPVFRAPVQRVLSLGHPPRLARLAVSGSPGNTERASRGGWGMEPPPLPLSPRDGSGQRETASCPPPPRKSPFPKEAGGGQKGGEGGPRPRTPLHIGGGRLLSHPEKTPPSPRFSIYVPTRLGGGGAGGEGEPFGRVGEEPGGGVVSAPSRECWQRLSPAPSQARPSLRPFVVGRRPPPPRPAGTAVLGPLLAGDAPLGPGLRSAQARPRAAEARPAQLNPGPGRPAPALPGKPPRCGAEGARRGAPRLAAAPRPSSRRRRRAAGAQAAGAALTPGLQQEGGRVRACGAGAFHTLPEGEPSTASNPSADRIRTRGLHKSARVGFGVPRVAPRPPPRPERRRRSVHDIKREREEPDSAAPCETRPLLATLLVSGKEDSEVTQGLIFCRAGASFIYLSSAQISHAKR